MSKLGDFLKLKMAKYWTNNEASHLVTLFIPLFRFTVSSFFRSIGNLSLRCYLTTLCTENTHLLCKRTHRWAIDLLFYYFWFNCFVRYLCLYYPKILLLGRIRTSQTGGQQYSGTSAYEVSEYCLHYTLLLLRWRSTFEKISVFRSKALFLFHISDSLVLSVQSSLVSRWERSEPEMDFYIFWQRFQIARSRIEAGRNCFACGGRLRPNGAALEQVPKRR